MGPETEIIMPLFYWSVFFGLVSFLFGSCIGSYLNVCIYRIPREMSTNNPRRSFCPSCSRQIPWYLNIPLFSWLILGGKCRYCKERISFRYFVVELLTAVLFLLVFMKLDVFAGSNPLRIVTVSDGMLVPVYWLMVSGLILGTFVDFEHMIIPDRVTLGGIAAGLVLSTIVPSMHLTPEMLTEKWIPDAGRSLLRSATGAAVGWLLLWSVGVLGTKVFKKEAMGFGDVKLIGAIGAFLGWKAVLFNVMVSSFAGALVGVTLIALGKREMGGRIPYGPYIALAAVLWILWGPAWIDSYIDLMTPDLTNTEIIPAGRL